MQFSIIIPAYNEEDRLPTMLESYAEHFLSKYGEGVELIVVVNGSVDGTEGVARDFANRHNQISVIVEPEKVGKGAAITLGAKAASGDWIGFVDADGATSAQEFDRLYSLAPKADGVIASRWIKGAQVDVQQKGLRLFSSRLFNLLIKSVLGLRYRDTQCGAKIFKREIWETILPKIGTTRFAYDVDLLYQIKCCGFEVMEEPTVWNDVEGSKVQVLNSSFDMFCAVIRMRLVHSPFLFVVRAYDKFLSRTVEFFLRDELFRHSALLFMASMITMVGNVGYQMVVGRSLSEKEFALLATFLALFAILNRPLSTLSTAVSHYTSLLLGEKRPGAVSRLAVKWVSLTGLSSLVAAIVCSLFAVQIASFFHLERVAPVMVSAVALPAIFIGPVVSGILQGSQRFLWVSLSGILSAFGRVLLAVLFVTLIYPACGWALAGHVGSRYLFLAIGLLGILPVVLKQKKDTQPLPSLRLYLVGCFLIQLSAAVLMTGDIVMVKHYLPADTDFAYASTLGRMVAFMAGSVVLAMFPKVSSEGEFTRKHRKVYLRSLLYSIG